MIIYCKLNKMVMINDFADKYIWLLKLGEEEHMKAFFEKGQVYFNPLAFFRSAEALEKSKATGDGRYDAHESASHIWSGKGIEGTSLRIEKGPGIIKPIEITPKNGLLGVEIKPHKQEFSHIYCMSSIDVEYMEEKRVLIDERNFANGKDWVVLIYDFFRLLMTKVFSLIAYMFVNFGYCLSLLSSFSRSFC